MPSCVSRLILISFIGLVAGRPQASQIQESRTENTQVDDSTHITLVPFYGGGKGQSLQIIEGPNGEIISTVIIKTPQTPPPPSKQTEIEINPLDLENPPLPSNFETEYYESYDEYIRNIQNKARKIIQLQEIAKRNGHLDEQQENFYQEYMASINQSAKKLAEAQESNGLDFENREGLSQWFERKSTTQGNKNKKKEDDKQKKKKEEEEDKRKKQEEEEKKKKKQEEEKNKQEEEEKEEEEGGDDGVSINLPPPEASVAEAKPVGLAVAGEGGVAASKPIATAVVGPGGLAIARPVATAIAGVSPEQALVPIYAEGSHKKNGSKNKTEQMSEFLNKIISRYHQS